MKYQVLYSYPTYNEDNSVVEGIEEFDCYKEAKERAESLDFECSFEVLWIIMEEEDDVLLTNSDNDIWIDRLIVNVLGE